MLPVQFLVSDVYASASRQPFWNQPERCQPRAVIIGDVHSEQPRRLFCARILTDEMATSGRLKEAFTGFVDFDRSGRGIFGTDRPREYISDDASGVMMYT
jgi:hypothetical protein